MDRRVTLEMSITDSRNLQEIDRPSLSTQQSWLLRPTEPKKKKSRKLFLCALGIFFLTAVVFGSVTTITKTMSRHKPKTSGIDNYTIALQKALMFFDAQKSGKLEHNNVTWRGDSCLQDGKGEPEDLVGGYYDAGDAIKFNFPMSYAMTLLSWSVIEYNAKYESAGELTHVKELIKWGSDYFLKTFNSSADTISVMVEQVGSGITGKESVFQNEHFCWMRPEDINYERNAGKCYGSCSYLAAEMAAALASASIVFQDNIVYSKKLAHGAKMLYEFADSKKHDHGSKLHTVSSELYESSLLWDELLWGGAWLYYATGNVNYLEQVTSRDLATRAGAFRTSSDYGVFSWDNKLPGAQLLLTRLRLFLSPGYPYEEILSTYHKQTERVMCSYLPYFHKFNRTKGGLIQLNHGNPRPLQYAANAAFLASLFSDYLDAADSPGWYCGPTFYRTDVLREFAQLQIDYILGQNPRNMSYLVGYGPKYPKHVHHRGASIPKNKVKYNCTGGWKWRDNKKPNPNTIEGAMVAGPDKHDGFRDVRMNYNYTEPTLAGNAGLVAALVALSSDQDASLTIDKNTIFSAVPSLFPTSPPPPTPWRP